MNRLAILSSIALSLVACLPNAETPFVCGTAAGFACPSGLVCELPAQGTTELPGACVAASDNRCAVSDDCAPGFGCLRDERERSGRCVPRSVCQTAAQCGQGELCVDWVGRDMGWARLSSGYCAPAPSQIDDVIECSEDHGCPAPLACMDGRCALECGIADDCPRGLSCLGQPGGDGQCLALR